MHAPRNEDFDGTGFCWHPSCQRDEAEHNWHFVSASGLSLGRFARQMLTLLVVSLLSRSDFTIRTVSIIQLYGESPNLYVTCHVVYISYKGGRAKKSPETNSSWTHHGAKVSGWQLLRCPCGSWPHSNFEPDIGRISGSEGWVSKSL